MDSTIPVEQRLIKAIQTLAPDNQQAVLDFVEFLHNHQSPKNSRSLEIKPTPFFGTEQSTDNGSVNLADHGIDAGQAAVLRSSLKTFAEDWDRPEMAVYDEL